jgi:hypothetical protein
MKMKIMGFLVCMLMVIPVFSCVATDSGPEIDFELRGWLNKKIIHWPNFGARIENTGDETALDIVVEVWISGGIFEKLRERLEVRDYWAFAGGDLEPAEEDWCPLGGLNPLYLGNIELTAVVSADNAEPVTQELNAVVGFFFIWVKS